MLILRQGETPVITIGIPDDINYFDVTNVWFYIYRDVSPLRDEKSVLIDKSYAKSELEYDEIEGVVKVYLSQEDTLALPVGTAYAQLKLYFSDGTAMPSSECPVRVLKDGKGEVISNDN